VPNQISLQIEPTAGITSEFRGRAAICANPAVNYGGSSRSVWALVGETFEFSCPEVFRGFKAGMCTGIDADKGEITFALICPASFESPPSRFLDETMVVKIESVGRLTPSSTNNYWQRFVFTSLLTQSGDAAAGAVFGALMGDAAGGVLEFLGRKPTQYECDEALNAMPGGGALGLAPGQFTDDGEMTVTLLAAINSSNGAYVHNVVARAYSTWAESEPFDIGQATTYALLGDAAACTMRSAAATMLRQAADSNMGSKANGSLMRASPLGVLGASLTPEETIDIAAKDARLTHPNPTCVHATVAYVLAIRHLVLNTGDYKGAFATAQEYVELNNEEVSAWLEDADNGDLSDAMDMVGFVRHAFTLGFYHLRKASDYAKGIQHVLRQGGDTDTNACIAGGLLGALHGMKKLPERAMESLITCDTTRGRDRPCKYTINPVISNLRDFFGVISRGASGAIDEATNAD